MSDQDSSIFSSPDQGKPAAHPNQTAGTSGDPTTGPLAILVGEGRKYSNVEDLAKAYLSADEFIEKLKGENSTLREELAKAKTLDEVFERLDAASSRAPTDQGDKKTAPSGLTAEQVAQLVRQTVTGLESERTRNANLLKADAQMKQLFGEKAGEVFQKEASTPEMKRALVELASVSPDKFVALFAPVKAGGSAADGTTRVNTNALNIDSGSGVRNLDPECKEFYDEMRRKEPAKYYSQAIQLQMNRTAVANPGKFFNRSS